MFLRSTVTNDEKWLGIDENITGIGKSSTEKKDKKSIKKNKMHTLVNQRKQNQVNAQN